MRFSLATAAFLTVVSVTLAGPPVVYQDGEYFNMDFGTGQEHQLWHYSQKLFGIVEPLSSPADAPLPGKLTLATGLSSDLVSDQIAANAGVFGYYPSDKKYSHVIICIDTERTDAGDNPSVQRVDVRTGAVETILYGMNGCGALTITPWGSVLVGESTPSGYAYEIYKPLATTGHWIGDRVLGKIYTQIAGSEPSRDVYKRAELPNIAYSGLIVYPEGVVYATERLIPGIPDDHDGGAVYKFVPSFGHVRRMDEPRTFDDVPDHSPLVDGSVFAYQASCVGPEEPSFPLFGQGCEIGIGSWVKVPKGSTAASVGATGYFLPNDIRADPLYYAKDGSIRFCISNTGRSLANHYSEVVCFIDSYVYECEEKANDNGLIYQATTDLRYATAVSYRLVEGDKRFHAFGKLAFNPYECYKHERDSAILYVAEKGPYGEVWACLPDGVDQDLKSDGCIPVFGAADDVSSMTAIGFDYTGRTGHVVLAGSGTGSSLYQLTGFWEKKVEYKVYRPDTYHTYEE